MAEVLGWMSLVVALLGIPAAYYFGRDARRQPRIVTAIDHDTILRPMRSSSVRTLDLRYGTEPVEALHRTIFAIWNRSGDTVRGGDALPDDPIRLVPQGDGAQMFEVTSLRASREQVDGRVEIVDNEAVISFRFLDPGDGLLVQVIHSGTTAPQLRGTVPGVQLPAPRSQVLSDKALAAQKLTRVQRVREYFTGSSSVLLPTWIGFGVFFGALYLMGRRTDPQLVDPATYDLDSLLGQKAFADRVEDVGISTQDGWLLVWIWLALPVVVLLVFAIPALVGPRRRVPPTLLPPGPDS